MKRKSFLAMSLAVVIISVFASISASATCGNWYVDSALDAVCVERKCGFFLWPETGTQYQDIIEERSCTSKTGLVYYEQRISTKDQGCCTY
mgnify:CR=1 FL=1